MHLRRYQEYDFSLLQQWVTSAALLFQFAGTDFSYPLTKEQLIVYRALHPYNHQYIATVFGDPVAFGEIIPQDNNIPRLARLLIGDSAQRGKGLGTSFVQLLIEECKRLYQCSFVELYVLEDNIPAIRCYEKLGFYPVPEDRFKLVINSEEHTIYKMRLAIT